ENHLFDFYNKQIQPYQENAQTFRLYGFKRGAQSVTFQSDRGMGFDDLIYPYETETAKKYESLMKENLTVKDILPTLLEDGTLKDNYGPEKNIEIQAQQFITIHGINMQRSELSVTDVADGTLTDFLVCYTFIYDHIPYLWKMDRGDFALF